MESELTLENYAKEYKEYLIYFHGERDYFECHEVLEEYWKAHPESELREAWVGLIQVAVGMYHHRRGNIEGAKKMLSSAMTKLSEHDLDQLGIDASVFQYILAQRLTQLQETPDMSFKDINIPLKDEALLNHCLIQCKHKKLSWGQPSNVLDDALIHKHTLRDRTEVIETRLKQLALKNAKRMLREE